MPQIELDPKSKYNAAVKRINTIKEIAATELMSSKNKKEKTKITKCPRCGSRKFCISIFGSICPDCFYEDDKSRHTNWYKRRFHHFVTN